MMLAATVLMFATLRHLVEPLKGLVMARVEAVFDGVIFRTAGRAMVFGILITILVQSSSITTSLAVPLAGAGILTLWQILPYTLGANVGTTITAMLAALAVGDSTPSRWHSPMLFNVCGIVVIWPIPASADSRSSWPERDGRYRNVQPHHPARLGTIVLGSALPPRLFIF